MSIHTGRIGTPPHKSRLHIGNDTVLAALIVLTVVLVFVWLISLTMQSTAVSTTPALTAGQAALYEQRVGEWNAGAPAAVMGSRSLYDQRTGEWNAAVPSMIFGSRALYEQRVGEWSTGQIQPVTIPKMRLDNEWLSRLAQARASGIR